MPKVRHYADLAATLAGLMWLVVYWSISLSAHLGNLEPTLAALLLLGTTVLVTFVHRPTRVLLRRYHVRKRRTEMWMHILALPLFIAFLFGVTFELIFTPLSGVQKLLLFNVVATAGWLVFIVTMLVKLGTHKVKQRRKA
ncbi:hypothetical protein LWH48_04490 [Halomonas sp. G15]|uniref:hypothetical protein n=1 Tax=Halomonas sp. G15 TaxID=2903521 RepID=UPI001E2A9325|nr:hypothetical protein [Halomonas sp. G15]MCE0732057.1 hypothetical protein [Halomonas sp. G15]